MTWMHLFRWSKERFPIPGVLAYAGAQVYLAYTFSGRLPDASPFSVTDSLTAWALLFLLLLRLRINDEHKDYPSDRIAYPNRLLSRGVITFRQLDGLFVVSILVEVVLIASLGRLSWGLLWLGINLWFTLMTLEFGVPRFLNAHIGWYLISHQMLLPLFALLPIVMRIDPPHLPARAWVGVVLFQLTLICGTMTYEIARKTWAPDRESPHAVSYSRDWGLGVTVFVNQGVAWICCAVVLFLMSRFGTRLWPAIPMVSVNLLFLATELDFLRQPTYTRAQRVKHTGTLVMFIAFAGGIIGFIR